MEKSFNFVPPVVNGLPMKLPTVPSLQISVRLPVRVLLSMSVIVTVAAL